MNRLSLKSRLIGSPLEDVAMRLRAWARLPQMVRHPELSEVFLEESRLPLVLARLLPARARVVDVGGHLGSFTSLAMRIAPEGAFEIFEASPAKAAMLRRRLPRAVVHAVAVSEAPGRAVFEENLARPGFSRLRGTAPTADPVDAYEVELVRLDDRLSGPIDLLKIDIEGHELAALKGARRLIAESRPAILFECQSEHDLAKIGGSRRALYDFLTGEAGYAIFTFGDILHGKSALTFSEFEKCGLYPFRAFNFIALPARPAA